MTEAVPGRLWTFDQLLGIFYVHVPIRMTVLRLDSGGLFVYAPVAPTKEVLSMLAPIIAAHGPVRHIVLPSVAPEHKVNAGPFARQFPDAEFWTTDRQYSFPLNLPPTWLGQPGRIKVLPSSSAAGGPLAGELDFEILTARASKESVYQEAAFFHRCVHAGHECAAPRTATARLRRPEPSPPWAAGAIAALTPPLPPLSPPPPSRGSRHRRPSRSLLVCDAIISVSEAPPPILLAEPEYRRALLYHVRRRARAAAQKSEAAPPSPWRRRCPSVCARACVHTYARACVHAYARAWGACARSLRACVRV